jgi:hypothetical protein
VWGLSISSTSYSRISNLENQSVNLSASSPNFNVLIAKRSEKIGTDKQELLFFNSLNKQAIKKNLKI